MKIYQIKSGKAQIFKDWAQKINKELYTEAIKSLEEENVTREIFVMLEINDIHYVIGHMEGDNIVPSNVNREINLQHKQVMQECIEKVIPIEVLYDLRA